MRDLITTLQESGLDDEVTLEDFYRDARNAFLSRLAASMAERLTSASGVRFATVKAGSGSAQIRSKQFWVNIDLDTMVIKDDVSGTTLGKQYSGQIKHMASLAASDFAAFIKPLSRE